MKSLLTVLLAFALLVPASAIELSLEENKAERGSIGYIDMQRLFKTFPDTVRAKENFEEIVRQAEEQLNLRKAEILRLRNELSQLKIEREFIARNIVVEAPVAPAAKAPEPKTPEAPKLFELPKPVAVATTTATAPNATPTVAGGPTHAPAVAASTPTAKPQPMSLATLPGLSAASTDTAKALASTKKPEPLTINIPGVSTAPIVVQPPQEAVKPVVLAAPKASTGAFTTPPLAAATTAHATVPVAVEAPPNPALVEIDAKIAVKARDLAQKEADFKEQQGTAEKNLLDLESRKTEILLGKMYKAVQVVARKEGVSVVVDKGNILYGHDAVDITEKVLKLLKGEQQ